MKMRRLVKLFLLAALLPATLSLHAQQIYRIVGPDGRVTFSDQPPPSTATAKGASPTVTTGGAAAGSGTSGLPYELRQVVSRYPVTLYTGTNCAPCASARSFLTGRGVPFTERTITTPEDAEALERLSGATSLPFMTLGTQRLKGFSDTEWNQFLTAAGYPQTSQLPTGWRNPPAAPMVTAQKPAAPASQPEAAPTQAATTPDPGPAPANPAGIRF